MPPVESTDTYSLLRGIHGGAPYTIIVKSGRNPHVWNVYIPDAGTQTTAADLVTLLNKKAAEGFKRTDSEDNFTSVMPDSAKQLPSMTREV